jgi:hypothetical protein
MGAPDDVINKITLEALKIQSDETALEAVSIPKFEVKPLPEGNLKISEWIENIHQLPPDLRAQFDTVVEYIWFRKLDPMADFYWTPMSGLSDRLIVPFRLNGEIVGHTARKVTDGKPKYISDQTPGYVFNLDRQTPDREFVIVVEGPMDALSIDAVAILGAEIMDKQALLINRLNRPVIVVPDRDSDGKRTVDQAIALGYGVSMPDWPQGIKDVNDAVQKLGKLTALYLVVQAHEHNELKIRLRAKTWF